MDVMSEISYYVKKKKSCKQLLLYIEYAFYFNNSDTIDQTLKSVS